MVPAGRAVNSVGADRIPVSPVRYGKLCTASLSATKSVLPTSAMPIGEFRPCRNTCFSTEPGFDSRNSVIRLALGWAPEPARFIASFCTLPRTPLLSSGLGGASASATSTSPFGSTYSQRGCWSSAASAVALVPSATCGFAPSCQPVALATRSVGRIDLVGATNCGDGPYSGEDAP